MYAQGGIGQPIHLQDLFRSTTQLIYHDSIDDLWIVSCSKDPTEVQPGDAFFAVGPKKIGNNEAEERFFNCGGFNDLPDCEDEDPAPTVPKISPRFPEENIRESIQIAIENGCKVVIADRVIPGLSVPLMVVKNPGESYGRCCHSLWGNPGESLKIIGVSGTYGKTSTSYLIAGMLAESGNPVGLIGSLGIYDGEKVFPTSQTTPAPDEIAYWLMRMRANGCSHAILEVSSKALEKEHLAGMKLDAICMCNIRRNHLDLHGTVESYRRTKLGIFKYLKKEGIAICNGDDRVTSAVLPLIDHPVLTTGIHNACEVSGICVERNIGEQTYLITAGSEAVPIQTKMIGEEHAYNCLSTAALGIGLGIDLRTTVRGIERVQSVPGRMERIDCGQPFGVFVDCAATAESLRGSLKSLREVVHGRIFCVWGCEVRDDVENEAEKTAMKQVNRRQKENPRDFSKNSKKSQREISGQEFREYQHLCKVLDEYSDYSIFTADELQSPYGKVDPDWIRERLDDLPAHKMRVIETRPEAIRWALSHADPEDCVLIVGRGCSDFRHFMESRDTPLCDRKYVKEWLYENTPCMSETLGYLF